jgi:large conductance mechanosensitive channel
MLAVNKVKNRFDDFKQFAMKGNVIDLAVGVIIGGAFGKIVTSLVNDVLMPLIGLIAGRVDLSSLALTLRPGDTAANIAALTLRYGSFLQSIVDFLIIAASIYLFIKLISNLKRKQEKAAMETPAVVPTKTEELLVEIRDLLKEDNKRG